MFAYIALGVAIAQALYVATARWRGECSVTFTVILMVLVLGLNTVFFVPGEGDSNDEESRLQILRENPFSQRAVHAA